MTFDLGRRLLLTSAIQPGELRRAVFDAVSKRKAFPRALADSSATARDLLSRPWAEKDRPTIHAVTPVQEIVDQLPLGLVARLFAVPVRKDPLTGTIDLAVADPLDPHPVAEVAFHLGVPVRAVAAPLQEIDRALQLLGEPEQAVETPVLLTNPIAMRRRAPPAEEAAMPLVRRARGSLLPNGTHTKTLPPESITANAGPPTTHPFERHERRRYTPDYMTAITPEQSAAMNLVVDFSKATREGQMPETQRGLPIVPKAAPFPSLNPILEEIDAVMRRDPLLDAIVRGLCTTAACSAIFGPRKGRYVGLASSDDLDRERVRESSIGSAAGSAFGEAIARGERIGVLDPEIDASLYAALDLERFGKQHVLIHTCTVAGRPALLLVSFGFTDPIEASRRARVLSTAASAALSRLLRRP